MGKPSVQALGPGEDVSLCRGYKLYECGIADVKTEANAGVTTRGAAVTAFAVTTRTVILGLMRHPEVMYGLHKHSRRLPHLLSNPMKPARDSRERLRRRGRTYPGQQKRQPDQDPSHLLSRAREHRGPCADSSFESQ